jgi:hypothetical protein
VDARLPRDAVGHYTRQRLNQPDGAHVTPARVPPPRRAVRKADTDPSTRSYRCDLSAFNTSSLRLGGEGLSSRLVHVAPTKRIARRRMAVFRMPYALVLWTRPRLQATNCTLARLFQHPPRNTRPAPDVALKGTESSRGVREGNRCWLKRAEGARTTQQEIQAARALPPPLRLRGSNS